MKDLKQFIRTTIREFLNETYISDIEKKVNYVFKQTPYLEKIGSKKEYSNYLNTIFSESILKDLYYHETDGDWWRSDEFNISHFGKTDDGFYGKGFYFSTLEGIGGYGHNVIFVKLYSKKIKTNITTHWLDKVILSELNPIQSKNKAISWINEKINYYEDELNNLKNNVFFKHSDIPKNVDYETYWENKKNMKIGSINNIISDLRKSLANIDKIISDYYSYDSFTTGEDLNSYEEILIRNPNNIHILGSDKDIDGFKKYMNK